MLYRNKTFKIFALTSNDEFELPEYSNSVFGIQYCFEYITKKHGRVTDDLPIQIYFNKIETHINFKIKI